MRSRPFPTWPAGLLLLSALGCGSLPPVFPPLAAPLVFPAGETPSRYAWVGKIEGEADLKRPRSFWKKIGRLIAGPEPEAKLQSPYEALAIGQVLYVSDPDLHAVHRFDLETREYRALTRAGKGPDGKERPFVFPLGLAADGDRLVVSDRGTGRVTVLSPTGEPEVTIGEGKLEAPVGVAVGPISHRIYVADVAAHQVKVFEPDGTLARAIGGRGREDGKFNYPIYVACDGAEDLFVSDSLNFRVQRFDREGKFRRSWGKLGDTPGDFSQPKGIAVDSGGRVYVIDARFENVQVFDGKGLLLLAIGEEGGGPGQFWLPVGVHADAEGRIWVGDLYNRRVQLFQYLGDRSQGAQP